MRQRPTRVTDPDPRALPVLRRKADEDDESGRGLALLDALSLRWGVDRRPGSKTVWCEPPTSTRTPAAQRTSAGRIGLQANVYRGEVRQPWVPY
ncbi:ATP-binding protein [Streptomyces sp. NPDC017179]|uniref:ATP-binding protein n=1 Tax=Streptomyces sp. NPDC017179 TaxID=3364979 RepID=UPI00379AD61A